MVADAPPPARPRAIGPVLLAALVAAALAFLGAQGWGALTSGGSGSGPAASVTGQRATTPGAVPHAGQTTAPRPTAAATPSAKPTGTTAPAPKAPASTAGLVPVVGVSDGDTIKVRLNGVTERVRVIGIDTPELASKDCFAQEAASRMQSLVQSKSVRLVADATQADRDRYGRLLRHVQLADGRSVAQILIAGGFGKEYTYDRAYAGQAAYRKAQEAARTAHRGIWSSACTSRAAATPGSLSPAAPQRCTIKGNIASDGEKIYHLPGQEHYAATVITESKGERWFCTEAEAVAAGWRAAKR
jgi:micrococcal nuclease